MKFYQSLVKGQSAALELSDEGLRVGRGFPLIQSSRKALLGAGSGKTKGEFQDHPALSDPAVGETLCKQRVSEWISSAAGSHRQKPSKPGTLIGFGAERQSLGEKVLCQILKKGRKGPTSR